MKRFAKHWERFWFGPTDARVLGLLRWGIGIVFLMNRTDMNRLVRLEWEHMVPTFPLHDFTTEAAYRMDAFRLPYPGFTWLPVPSLAAYQWLEITVVLLGLLFTIGVRARISGPLTALLAAYMFLLSQFSYHHGDFALLVALSCVAFAPAAGRRYGVEQWIGIRSKRTAPSILPVRLLQTLCSTILIFGALNKMNGAWWRGEVLSILWSNDQLAGPLAALMAHYDLFAVCGISVIGALLFSGIGIWIPRLRRAALIVGVFTQIAIDMTYWNALTFNYLMIVLLCTFLTAEDIRLLRRFVTRGSARAR